MKIRPRTAIIFLLILGTIYLLVKAVSVYWLLVFFNIFLIFINSVFLFAYFDLKKPKQNLKTQKQILSLGKCQNHPINLWHHYGSFCLEIKCLYSHIRKWNWKSISTITEHYDCNVCLSAWSRNWRYCHISARIFYGVSSLQSYVLCYAWRG